MLKKQEDIEIRTSKQLGKRLHNTTNRWWRGSERARVWKRGRPEVFGGASASGHLLTLFRILRSRTSSGSHMRRVRIERGEFDLTTGDKGEIDMLSGRY